MIVALFLSATFGYGCCFGFGLFLGAMRSEGEFYNRQYLAERDLIAPILSEDFAYSRVEVWRRSNGGIYLVGDVPTAADLARLRDRITRAVGETRANEILLGVEAKKK